MSTTLCLHSVEAVKKSVTRYPNGIEGSSDPYIVVTLEIKTSDGHTMLVRLFSTHGSMKIAGMPK